MPPEIGTAALVVPASLLRAEVEAKAIQAFMEVSQGLEGDGFDLILHSPGRSPEVAEAIVSYLRSCFSHIRVIVPQLAMSAATMIACAADEFVQGNHAAHRQTLAQDRANDSPVVGTKIDSRSRVAYVRRSRNRSRR